MKGAEEETASNRVPLWNGKPEEFQHYIKEIKWFLATAKQADCPYAAARLIRRALDSEYVALRTFIYKLEPSEFTEEEGIHRLVTLLGSVLQEAQSKTWGVDSPVRRAGGQRT